MSRVILNELEAFVFVVGILGRSSNSREQAGWKAKGTAAGHLRTVHGPLSAGREFTEHHAYFFCCL